ncbi:MAG TPA: hypothetical protein VFC00_33570 [Micromonosporaceae bacterium]|nr:hypothetical protein [Micromonosporaceae bacterium]
MDVFSRTFLPATAEAALPIPTVSRHMPAIRRCVEPDDATVFINRCLRPERPLNGEHLLLLTQRRLVVTTETRFLHRIRLYLNADVRDLTNVDWTPDLRMSAVELAVTAHDGIRERFWIKLGMPSRVWHLDALLSHVFRPRPAVTTHRADPPAAAPEHFGEGWYSSRATAA